MQRAACEPHLVSVFHELEQLLLDFNANWQQRKRKLDTRFVVNFVMQLVTGSIGESYRMVIQNSVNESPVFKKSLFSKLKSIAASSVCEARQKVDENVFILMNQLVTKKLMEISKDERKILPSRRAFAIDGTKLNLPPELVKYNFHPMTAKGHHPQALVSCIYSLDDLFPLDFTVENSGNERASVERHLLKLNCGDVVIYDRGYFSFQMVKMHLKHGIDFIFRLPRGGFKSISEFMDDPQKPAQANLELVPTKQSQAVMKCENKAEDFTPVKIRLIRSMIDSQEYFFATSLPAEELTPDEIRDAYSYRWKIEELYKIPKAFLELEKFHAKTSRGICQEIYASFFIVSLSRLFDSIGKKKLSQTKLKSTVRA